MQHWSPTPVEWNAFAYVFVFPPLSFINVGEKCRLKLGEISNSDNDASTYASITDNP